MPAGSGSGRLVPLLRGAALSTRAQMAVKAALAAALAWVAADAVTAVLGTVEDYRYYAPLGAVTATYPTVMASARTARSAVVAVGLGAGLGLVAHVVTDPSLLALMIVVGAGVALGALPVLGDQRSWVPVVALFVLVIGGSHPVTYAAAYVGLAALGALCGVGVNLLLPGLPLRESRAEVDRLRAALAAHFGEVAAELRDQIPGEQHDWQRRRNDLDAAIDQTQRAMRAIVDEERGNLRARFHHAEVQRQVEATQVLRLVGLRLNDLMALLGRVQREELASPPLDEPMAAALADAVERLGDLVLVYDEQLADDHPALEGSREALGRLTAEYNQPRNLDAHDLAIAVAAVSLVRQTGSALGLG